MVYNVTYTPIVYDANARLLMYGMFAATAWAAGRSWKSRYLPRASSTLEEEMSQGAPMLQLQRAGSVVEALKAMVPASALSAADASRVTALVQTSPADDDADIDGVLNATHTAGHEDHSGGILQTVEGLLEKAEAQLDTARTTETSNLHNFAMLRQSWTEQIKSATKDAGKSEKCISEAEEAKATASGPHCPGVRGRQRRPCDRDCGTLGVAQVVALLSHTPRLRHGRWRRVRIPVRSDGWDPKPSSKLEYTTKKCNKSDCKGDEACTQIRS